MQPLTSESAIVSKYFGFVDLLGQRLRGDSYYLDGTTLGTITEQLPGLQPLFDSLVAASPTAKKVGERRLEDWNPFSQRILLSDETPPDSTAFERDFSLIATYAQTFVEWGHEAMHVLAMEPWLCGRREISLEEEFVNWCLASEALAFWYADIIITRTIRQSIPEAELVYNRQSVSNTCFHPEQAFRRLGLTDANPMLQLYIDAFLGKDTALGSRDHPFPKTLGLRLNEFYAGTTKTLRGLYTLLDSFQLFTDFYSRFCVVEGLPSLLDDAVLNATEPLDAYHARLGTELLPGLREHPAELIRRVCARRHIQTRAYYAWFMKRAFDQRWVFGNAQLDSSTASAGLGHYLDCLEKTLRTFAAEGDPSSVVDKLKQIDGIYETQVRQHLDQGQAHVKYRYRLYPYFAPTGGIVGLADQRSNYSADEMLEVAQFVMERCSWDATLIGRLHRFLTTTTPDSTMRETFNDFMTHPLALPVWSVRLSEITPARNQFREFVFEYT